MVAIRVLFIRRTVALLRGAVADDYTSASRLSLSRLWVAQLSSASCWRLTTISESRS